MVVTDLPFDMSLIKGSMPITGDGTRSHGLHLMQIVGSLAQSIGVQEDSANEEQLQAYASVGFIWERIVEQGMALACESQRYVRPGEVMLDGITGSPDLLDLQESIVIDTKVTFKSSSKLADLQRNHCKWIWQLKGYCRMIEWRTAELWILPMCSDWKPPMIAPPVRKRLEFSKVELDENWRMLTQHAKEKGWL